jgi:hemolysin III
MPKRPQTPKEEFANATSHGFGLLLGLIAIPFLIQNVIKNGSVEAWIGGLTFSFGILMVYTFSTFYHAAKNPKWKSKLQVLDHIAIYFLIAGSYTPMVLSVLKQDKAIIFLSILWASVLVGTFFKLIFTGRFKILSLIIYLTMGWLAVFFIQDIVERISIQTLIWLGVGGVAYTIGVYFYAQSNRLYYHAV